MKDEDLTFQGIVEMIADKREETRLNWAMSAERDGGDGARKRREGKRGPGAKKAHGT